MGWIYLLHFHNRLGHAGHYTGYAEENPDARIKLHRLGQGARLTSVLHEQGITFEVAFIREGTRDEERRLKNLGGAARYCPICKAQELPAQAPLRKKEVLNAYRQKQWGVTTWTEREEQLKTINAEVEALFGPP